MTNQIRLHSKWTFLGADSRYFVITGGRASGKSFALSYFLVNLIYLEPGHRIWASRATMVSAKESIIKEVQDRIIELGLEDDFIIKEREVINKTTGSSIFFKGLQSSRGSYTAALKGGAGITTFFLDEAEELDDYEIFQKINLSFRTKHQKIRIILALNPTTREHWVYDRFFTQNKVKEGWTGKKGDTTYIHTNWLDNKKNLDDTTIKEMLRIKENNPVEYDNVIMGGWRARAEGVIFKNWREGYLEYTHSNYNDIKTGDPLPYDKWEYETDHIIYGQDFGYSPDKTTLVKIAIDDRNKRIYLHECYCKAGLSTEEIQDLNIKYAGEKELIIVDSSNPRLTDEVARRCNVIGAAKGPGSVLEGIKIMLGYELIVTPESINLIRELNNYAWDEDKIDKPLKGWDHCIDAARYGIMYELLDTFAETPQLSL